MIFVKFTRIVKMPFLNIFIDIMIFCLKELKCVYQKVQCENYLLKNLMKGD